MPPTATAEAVDRVTAAMDDYGPNSIIALAGPPATGKTHVAKLAARKYAGEPLRVQESQFHPNYGYEQFMEGMGQLPGGIVGPVLGSFLKFNEFALMDAGNRYVFVIDEFTRADVPAVLGELLTYIEYRGETFERLYQGAPAEIAPNLVVLATFNPADRSALELDDAVMRRMEILQFLPDVGQLRDMLGERLPVAVVERLGQVFTACQTAHPALYEHMVPFGHGVFAHIESEDDLHPLWNNRLRHLLYRPSLAHPFAETIRNAYPWTDPGYAVPGG